MHNLMVKTTLLEIWCYTWYQEYMYVLLMVPSCAQKVSIVPALFELNCTYRLHSKYLQTKLLQI